MLGKDSVCERPIETLVRTIGVVLVEDRHLRRSYWYHAGGRLYLLLPDWLTGVAAREGAIARLVVLVALAGMGQEAAVEAFGAAFSHLGTGEVLAGE